jgi:hypothetical protein
MDPGIIGEGTGMEGIFAGFYGKNCYKSESNDFSVYSDDPLDRNPLPESGPNWRKDSGFPQIPGSMAAPSPACPVISPNPLFDRFGQNGAQR